MTTSTAPPARTILTYLVFGWATVALWAVVFFVIAVAAITGLLAWRVDDWGAEPTAILGGLGWAPRVFALIAGVGLFTDLRLMVVFGRTRRAFAGQALAFAVLFSAALTLVYAALVAAEAAVYTAVGWVPDRALAEVAALALSLWPTLCLWTAIGLLCTAAFNRHGYAGLWSVVAAAVLVTAGEIALGDQSAVLAGLLDLDGPFGLSAPVAVVSFAVPAVLFAATCAAVWPLLRRSPIFPE